MSEEILGAMGGGGGGGEEGGDPNMWEKRETIANTTLPPPE